MSILTVTSAFPSEPGGREGNFVHDSVEALAETGCEVSVLISRPFMPEPLAGWIGRRIPPVSASSFPRLRSVETISRLSFPRHFLKSLSNAAIDRSVLRGASRLARQEAFDLIHGHGEETAWPVVQCARRLGAASLVTIHGLDTASGTMGSPVQRERYRRALGAVDRVVLVGEPLRDPFRALVGRDDHFRVVPNGFRPPPAKADQTLARVADTGGTVRLISVSNLNEGKGIDVALDALSRLVRNGCRNWYFDVVGDGRQRAALEAQAVRLRIGDRVRFLGAQPHAHVYSLLAQGDVFLLPSYREAFGIAYLEAMAMGLLAIGVAGQGPQAFIRDGATGFLVPPRDPAALAQLLLRVIENPGGWRPLAEEGREEAYRNWTWAGHARRLLEVYAEAVRERSW